MVYVALLRGINVGGNNKVEMKRLKEVFEKVGFTSVSSYINSGNIIFESKELTPDIITKLNKLIEKEFGFAIKILIKSLKEMQAILKVLPDDWTTDSDTKCDVMFLWKDVDNKKALEELIVKPDIDQVKYTKGAILWSIQKINATKSGISRLIGTKLYSQMTIRNSNTLKKLTALMEAVKS